MPPPAVTVNTTGWPDKPSSSAATRRTTSESPSTSPIVPAWSEPWRIWIVSGSGCTPTVPVSAGPVSSVATIRASPRCVPPITSPLAALGTLAISGSSELHPIGVFGIGSPSASSATASSTALWPVSRFTPVVRIETDTASTPTPTYSSSTSTTGGVPLVTGLTSTGPPRKAVSPAGVMAVRVRENVSLLLVSGTVIATSTSSVPSGRSTIVSLTRLLSLVRRRMNRILAMGTMPAALLEKEGATAKYALRCGPAGSSVQLRTTSPVASTAVNATTSPDRTLRMDPQEHGGLVVPASALQGGKCGGGGGGWQGGTG